MVVKKVHKQGYYNILNFYASRSSIRQLESAPYIQVFSVIPFRFFSNCENCRDAPAPCLSFLCDNLSDRSMNSIVAKKGWFANFYAKRA